MWNTLNEYLLLTILDKLSLSDLFHVALTCKWWFWTFKQDILWRRRLIRDYGIDTILGLPPGIKSWRSLYKKWFWQAPVLLDQDIEICDHSEEITHVCFSPEGDMFATVGFDLQLFVYKTINPVHSIFEVDFSVFHWTCAQQCEFNSNGRMLMVSGAKATDLLGRTFGEMVVFSVKEEFEICARITNKPSDVVGCWYNDNYLISADFKWLSNSHRVSTSLLWLNKITPLWSERAHDYTLSCMRSLFKFYNPNGSCVRHFLVCNVPPPKRNRKLTQDELLNENLVRQILARESRVLFEQRIPVPREIPTLPKEIDDKYISFMRGHTFEIHSESDISTPGMFEYSPKYRDKRQIAFDLDDTWVYEGNDENSDDEDEDDWEYFDEKEAELAEKSRPEYLKIDRGHEVINEKEKLLIFTTGSLVQVPHQVGIKKMSCVRFREHMDLSQSSKDHKENSERNQRALRQGHESTAEMDTVDWSDYPNISHMFDHIDVILDFPGRVVGLASSPDSRFLYVSYRPWPKDFVIKSYRDNPPLASEAFCSVIDLESFDEVGTFARPIHRFTSNSRLKTMANPDVGRDLIVMPLGTEHAGLFDRFYGVQLGEFSHLDVINHVSLEPTLGQMAVSVGDDMKVQFWKSREMMAMKRRTTTTSKPQN